MGCDGMRRIYGWMGWDGICRMGSSYSAHSSRGFSVTDYIEYLSYMYLKVNDKDILRVWKFSKTQPRPVAKNATPRPSVRIELTTPRI